MVEPGDDDDAAPIDRTIDRVMGEAERLVYVGIALLLYAAALAALVAVAYEMVEGTDEGTIDRVAAALDGLLLVFILVELLGAVRSTVRKRDLVAEPFLVVGIIACIKEIVVAALALADASGSKVDDGVLKIGVLGLVVLLLAVSAYLMRRKEREPAE
jgi:uncharacterized membrane protein (DUF373 family)